MRRRRLIGTIALLVWFVAVCWYWRTMVPLAPSAVFPAADGYRFQGFSREGMLHFVKARKKGGISTGPVRAWDPLQQRIVYERLSAEDSLLQYRWGGRSELVVAGRPGVVTLVDLPTGKSLLTLPVSGADPKVDLSFDERLMSVVDEQAIRVVAIPEGKTVWQHQLPADATWQRARFPGPDLFQAEHGPIDASDSALSGGFWNTSTWQQDTRFDYRTCTIEDVSANGQWARVHREGDGGWICDYRTGRLLWKVPSECSPIWTTFDRSGEQFIDVSGSKEALTIRRWNAADGRRLTPTIVKDLPGRGFLSPSERYAVVIIQDARRDLFILARFLNRLGVRWLDDLPILHDFPVFETESGKSLGFATAVRNADLYPDWHLDACDTGFTLSSDTGETKYYTLPPRRNWRWLAGWALGPLAAVWLMGITWRRVRRLPGVNRTSSRSRQSEPSLSEPPAR